MKHFLLSFLTVFLLINFSTSAQDFSESYWTNVDSRNVNNNVGRYIIPEVYRTLHLKLTDFARSLSSLPHENDVIYNAVKPGTIYLPHPDGDMYEFSVMESPIMEDGLAAKFPEYKTYRGQGITDRNSTIRFDVTLHGFHAMVISQQGTWYIDPYSMSTTDYYISYWKRDLLSTPERSINECAVFDDGISEQISQWVQQNTEYQIGEQLRTYRIAVAATGEYTAFHGGTVAAGVSAIVTAMNRVNQIYENDVAIRMVLIANNNLIVYTDPNTDPYTNNSGTTMLGQNQTNLDNVIGTANYDIGHVFSTGGGGVASLGVPCRAGLKARGVTGLPQPIGDPFYVDYVAHEMGHQWGANHTFNGNAGSCSGGNRNAGTAYEPGSGSTIMAYAGICGAQNLQNLSDDYFHGVSIDEIVAYSTVGSGNGCAVITNTGNNAPVVNLPSGGWVIPINTPFELTGSATDSDNDPLTYCWEQFNLGAAGAPASPSGDAPIFRSFKPVVSSSRVFPRLANLLNNTTTIGEILPGYTRNLTFRLTARDNRSGGGGVGKATLSFTANSAAGPFLVTAPNTNVTWTGNTLQTITWNVANTNAAPINTQNVKILLSTDGGNTWPHVVLESTANDGSEEVWVPNIPTTQARIKVAAIDNIYFDISNVNFSILFNDIPVELVSFAAEVTGNDVTLSWITATETNNQGFEIERTSSNKEWKSLGFVEGKGTTTEINNYLFKDENLKAGTYSYRLKQIDFDGTTQYHNMSSEVTVENPSTFVLLQNHPNPFNPSTVISYQLPVNGLVTLKVYDILGSEVVTLVNEFKEAGNYEVTFNSVDKNINLQSGVYFYQLRTEDFVATKKMLLIK